MASKEKQSPVRIAVIGCGVIGRTHAKLVENNPETELVAICDQGDVSLAFAKKLGVPYFSDYKEMIAACYPEAVIVATPTDTHREIGLACAERRCHLLVEKPLATNIDDGQKLVYGVWLAGVHLLVGHHRRYNPLVYSAKHHIKIGRLGKLVGVNLLWMLQKPESYYDIEWRKKPGGGIFLTNLIHEIDILRFCCGEIESVYAEASSATRNFEVEDTGAITLRFQSGAVGTILISDVAPSRYSYEQSTGENPYYFKTDGDCYHFFGTKASLSFPSMRIVEFADPAKAGWQYPLVQDKISVIEKDPLVTQLEHFCDVVRGKTEPLINGFDGLQTLRVVHGILESAKTRQPVAFGLSED